MRKLKLHWSHILAVLVLGSYFVISKINMANAFLKENLITSFLQLFIFGTLFTYLFLYIFSHEKFFPFAKEIKKEQQKKESIYLRKYKHHGKVLATFIIGVLGGPVFLSITTRLLLNNFKHRYLLILFTSFVSTSLVFVAGRGILSSIL